MALSQNGYGRRHSSFGKRAAFMDPLTMNAEQLTSTQTKQDLLKEEIHKLAMKTH